MQSADIALLESHVLQEQPRCTVCRSIQQLATHTKELQAFALAVADHHAAPGPSPEKTAEHYQLVSRAQVLAAQIGRPFPPSEEPGKS